MGQKCKEWGMAVWAVVFVCPFTLTLEMSIPQRDAMVLFKLDL